MAATVLRARLIACVVGLLTVAVGRPAAAETLNLAWDPSPNTSVVGYVVYVRIPGATSNSYDVGNTSTFAWSGAVAGQQYYFSIAAYTPGPVLGPRSAEIPRYPNLAPSLYDPGPQSSAVGSTVSLALTGSDPEGAPLTYGASGLPTGLQVGAATGAITGAPLATGTYTVTATVTDGLLSDAKTFTWAVLSSATSAPPSGPPPTSNAGLANVGPTLTNPGSQTAIRATSVTLQLAGSDPEGSTLTYGASGLPPGLQMMPATGKISGSPSTVGSYTVTATVSDGALSDAETFVWTITQPASDTVPPVVAITMPTTDSSHAVDQPFVLLGGTASDESRIVAVEWFSDRGMRGTASGAESWVATVTLVNGINIVTIRARDEAGNVGTRQILVKALIPNSALGNQRNID